LDTEKENLFFSQPSNKNTSKCLKTREAKGPYEIKAVDLS